jgi:hypothetical protein
MKIVSVFASLLILTLAGCGGNSSDEAQIRVFHASPDAPNVDVLIDGAPILENVPYQTASDFLPIDAGHRQVTVTAAGTTTAVIDSRVDLAKDTDYLIVAAGKLAQIAPIVAVSDRTAPAENNAKVRVLHAAPSAPNVDVYVSAPGGNISSLEPVLKNVPFSAISDYLTVPSGQYDLFVTVAGTKTVAISALGVSLASKQVASVAALDAPGAGAPFALTILEE